MAIFRIQPLLQIGFLPIAAALLSIYYVYAVVQKWNQRRTERRLGCEPVRSAGLKNDPFSVRVVLALRDAYARDEMPLFRIRSMDAVGPNAHTVKLKFLMNEALETRDPLNIKTVLSSDVLHYELGPVRGKMASEFFGINLFTSEGKAWKTSRSIVRPHFYLTQIADVDLFEKHLHQLLLKLDMDSTGWTRYPDLSDLLPNLTMDVASEFLFHHSVNSQNPALRRDLPVLKERPMPDMESLGHAYNRATDHLTRASFLGRWYWIFRSPGAARDTKIVMTICQWFADVAIARRLGQEDPLDKEDQYYFLDELTKTCLDREVLSQEVAGLLFAASNTTAGLLGWLFLYLSRQPSLYEKLRAEVGQVIGLDSTAPMDDISKLRNCDYLQNCISEALRLGTPAPITGRRAIQDTTLPTGGGDDGTAPIFIPKGTQIALNFFALHHRADLYGDDVEEFRPERWENREKGWDLCPFGGGPRICIGRTYSDSSPVFLETFTDQLPPLEQFALNEASYVIARIVQRYDKIKNLDPCKNIKYSTRFGNRSKTVPVSFHKAKASI
ncbi:MAG: hypothetical protein Q9212_002490 [Teloschistes hypoglaucus]